MVDSSASVALSEKISALDANERHAFNEYCTRAIAEKIIRRGDSVLDLGANEGFHTFAMCSLVGDEGRVHAFEPNPAHWSRLLERDNIRLWPVAVGDRISVENFYLPVESNLHQVGSLVNPSDFLGAVEMRILTVPQVTIDSLEELAAERFSFVKMDIERRELQCMLGMRRVLKESQPIIVYENNTPEIESLLLDFGYSIGGLIHNTKTDLLANVIAIPESGIFDMAGTALNEIEALEIIASVGA